MIMVMTMIMMIMIMIMMIMIMIKSDQFQISSAASAEYAGGGEGGNEMGAIQHDLTPYDNNKRREQRETTYISEIFFCLLAAFICSFLDV